MIDIKEMLIELIESTTNLKKKRKIFGSDNLSKDKKSFLKHKAKIKIEQKKKKKILEKQIKEANSGYKDYSIEYDKGMLKDV